MNEVFVGIMLSICLIVIGLLGIFMVYKETIKMLKDVTNRKNINNSYSCKIIKIDYFCVTTVSL